MKNGTGTEFSERSTQQAAEGETKPDVTMLSSLGSELASFSAPSSAFQIRTSSTSAVKEK